jgi:branched-chain amino acid transport system substrate-binding protein
MKRTLSISIIVLSVLLIFVGCGSGEAGVVKIGFVGPMTGDYANYGQSMSTAVQIAVDEINAAGGIDGVMVELIVEDSEGDTAKANAAFEKLANVDGIYGLVGAVFSSNSLAIAPKAQAQKVVMISPSSTVPEIVEAGNYIFRTVGSDALQAQVLSRYVLEELDIDKIAILYTKNDYSQGLTDGFTQFYEAAGGEVVAVESGLQGDKDFRTQLTNIKGVDAEGLLLPNYVAEIAQMIEQASQLGIDAQIISADGFSNPEILTLAPDFVDGIVFSGPAQEDAESTITADFQEVYTAAYGQAADSFSLNAYDGAKIILAGIESAYNQASSDDKAALNLNRDLIQSYVAGVRNYQGVSGEITFAANGDVIKNQGILEVVNGEYSPIGEFKVDASGNLVKVQ